MVFSASIVLTLGVLHLVYTFWGPSLTPRNPALQISMSQSSPIITNETTMWRCWVGFNASHSLGLILFGLVFGYLALAHGQLLFRSPFLLVVGLAMLVGFVVLCKVYFLVGRSPASAFLWPAMWPALRSRGPNNALLMQTAIWRCGTDEITPKCAFRSARFSGCIAAAAEHF
jgi:hypothetical protein